MRKWIAGVFALGIGFGQLFTTPVVAASSLDDIRQQQEQTKEEIDSLESQVNYALEDISEVTESLNQLNVEIEEKEETIKETEEEVNGQEEIVEARMEQARTRLQTLQTNEVNRNIVLTLLEAESISDLFNRTLVIMRLTDAGNKQIEIAQEEYDKLVELKEELLTARLDLESKVAVAKEQRVALDEKISSLRTLIQENESKLTVLKEREEIEVSRIEAERKEAERAAREQAEREAQQARAQQEEEQTISTLSSSNNSSVSQSSSSNVNNASSESSKSTVEASEPDSSASQNQSGRTLTVESTGYSNQQANLSNFTATGIDLRKNPRVIAVDPSVIPLGSMVEVEGLGVFIAGDTGGAIRGNKIDIHFASIQQANSWGRRSVNIRILD